MRGVGGKKGSLLAAALFFILMPQGLSAQISPGKLAEPHAFLEGLKNCTQCHKLGAGAQPAKCLDCHQEIKTRVDKRRGLHFLFLTKQKKRCFTCHAEHAGRQYEMIRWENGRDNFDHSQTGYILKGKHKTLECRDCHKPQFIRENLKKLQPKINLKKTFLGLNKDCLSCHEDEHRGQLSKDCQTCHTFKSWKPAPRFDHDRARFALTGKHRRVECAQCHPTVRDRRNSKRRKKTFVKFTGLAFASCADCHTDVHKGAFGKDCTQCHTTAGWKRINKNRFDHSKTRFPLVGLHNQVDCVACHKSGDFLKPLDFQNCNSCHEDVHDNKFGQDCKSCHTPLGWQKIKTGKFDHSKTGFPLRGLHKKVECKQCHTTGRMTDPVAHEQCATCHEDVHKGQFKHRKDGGRCETCHTESGFIPSLFGPRQHQKTRFPLRGAHLATPCTACHKLARTRSGTLLRRFVFKKIECETCHEDIHGGQFAKLKPVKQCKVCHTVNEWSDLKFIHNRDSRFKLDGAHEKVACEQCHKPVRRAGKIFVLYRPMKMTCESCHGPGMRQR